MTNGPRDPSDLYGVKADADARPLLPCAIAYGLTCSFVLAGVGT